MDATIPVQGGRLRVVGRMGRAGAAVTAAGMAVNALAYVAPLLGARTLSAADLSALATALALSAIASVAGLGLQTAIAVHRSDHGAVPNARSAALRTAAAATTVLLLASPIEVWALDLPFVLPLLVAAGMVAVVVGSRWLGELQGAQRYGALAAGMVVQSVGRYGGVIAGLAVGAGVTGSIALGVVVAWLGLPLLALLTRGGGPTTAAHASPLRLREVFNAGAATLAMLAISYADLIFARSVLPAAQAGHYAVGTVLARGALWAPGVVTVLALPLLARRSRRALLAALACVAACGVFLVLAAALAGGLAMRLAGGPAYAGLGGYAAGFAAVGALYAVAFVFVNDEIAARVRWPAVPLWIAFAFLAIAVHLLRAPTLGQVLALSVITAMLAASATGVLGLRTGQQRVRTGGMP
jgi:hypothetical protein